MPVQVATNGAPARAATFRMIAFSRGAFRYPTRIGCAPAARVRAIICSRLLSYFAVTFTISASSRGSV